MNLFREYLEALINLFFPNICCSCNSFLLHGEELVCTKCLYNLPKTNFHEECDNIVEQIFWGRADVKRATSFFYYVKGMHHQKLIHKMKYQGTKELGVVLGQYFGSFLTGTLFSETDMIIPVPLHPSKLKKRGFNQSEWIGKGLATALATPLKTNILVRKISSSTQTRKSRIERWENVKNIFEVRNKALIENRKILLVDDIITTGATLESCAHALLEVKGVELYVATLGYASLS